MELFYNYVTHKSVNVENKQKCLQFTLNHKYYDKPDDLRMCILMHYKPMYFGFDGEKSEKKRIEMLKERFEEEVENLEKEILKYKMLINICKRKKVEIVYTDKL